MIDHETVWPIIIALGIGSFAMRFLFLGPLGGVKVPEWIARHLKYTAVAILPALLVQMLKSPITMPPGGLVLVVCGIMTTLIVGYRTHHIILATCAGAIVLIVSNQIL